MQNVIWVLLNCADDCDCYVDRWVRKLFDLLQVLLPLFSWEFFFSVSLDCNVVGVWIHLKAGILGVFFGRVLREFEEKRTFLTKRKFWVKREFVKKREFGEWYRPSELIKILNLYLFKISNGSKSILSEIFARNSKFSLSIRFEREKSSKIYNKNQSIFPNKTLLWKIFP